MFILQELCRRPLRWTQSINSAESDREEEGGNTFIQILRTFILQIFFCDWKYICPLQWV